MIVTFSYPLPDELYVEGVSGEVTATYTYNGPETFDVEIDELGRVIDIDIQRDPENGPDYRKTINASTHTAVAYNLFHYFVDNYVWEYEFEDELMDNGDVYKRPLNPDLKDAYYIRYNFEKDDWDLLQVIREQSNPASLEAKARKEYVEKYSKKYSFSDEVESTIEKYVSDLDTFISNNPSLKAWKYINFNLNEVPKIPSIIAIEFAKLPSEGV